MRQCCVIVTFRLKKSLFLLVSVLSQAFFALVRRHLVSFVFLTVWHNIKILQVVFLLDSVHEGLSRLEGRNLVGRDGDGDVLANVATGLLGSRLDDEATKASQINVFALGHGVLHNFHEVFDNILDSTFFNASLACDFSNDFCFSHFFPYFMVSVLVCCKFAAKVRTFSIRTSVLHIFFLLMSYK